METNKSAMTKTIPVIMLYLLFCLTNSSAAQVLHRRNESICPVIKTTLGSIAGVRQHTVLGNSSFCSYRGIRYAEAPTAKLRFKAPVPHAPWEGTYNATEYGSGCKQYYFNMTGSEDCLFLNVFVPEPSICSDSSHDDIAVIVFIYGGGFKVGVANDDYYGPYLLLNECVILVTFNYRVAVFGFLLLTLPEYSGNMGLKDQQLALEWVNRHISAFGGNPEWVTLMGHSSGGASVSLHRLNPKSRSYFKRAYVMSGSAISHYVLADSNNKTDLIVDLAKNQSIEIKNSEQLIDYLQTVDADFLINHIPSNVLWQPCIEPETAFNLFISDDPEMLLSRAENLPSTVYTYTSLEAIYRYYNIISNPEKISYELTFPLPFHVLNQVACKDELDPIFTAIRRFYFGHAKINGSQILSLLQLIGFNNLVYFIQKEVVIQALSKSSSEIRLLRINLRTLLSLSLNRPGVAALAGTSHSDDLCSYFWCKFIKDTYTEIEMEETLAQQSTVRSSKILREILTSFANTGNPVSKTAAFFSFPSVGSDPLTDLAFTELMSISALGAGSNPDHEEFEFWWKINEEVDKIKGMPCNQK